MNRRKGDLDFLGEKSRKQPTPEFKKLLMGRKKKKITSTPSFTKSKNKKKRKKREKRRGGGLPHYLEKEG